MCITETFKVRSQAKMRKNNGRMWYVVLVTVIW